MTAATQAFFVLHQHAPCITAVYTMSMTMLFDTEKHINGSCIRRHITSQGEVGLVINLVWLQFGLW